MFRYVFAIGNLDPHGLQRNSAKRAQGKGRTKHAKKSITLRSVDSKKSCMSLSTSHLRDLGTIMYNIRSCRILISTVGTLENYGFRDIGVSQKKALGIHGSYEGPYFGLSKKFGKLPCCRSQVSWIMSRFIGFTDLGLRV